MKKKYIFYLEEDTVNEIETVNSNWYKEVECVLEKTIHKLKKKCSKKTLWQRLKIKKQNK
ncbi:MAG: hypothetical protein RR700_06450 [Anaerorhabdus sp.]|uniref:hypothetical protein n=1 Tax=Anaerorhabdus sp. TaxID=1872524 RepID=UPI002FC9AD03